LNTVYAISDACFCPLGNNTDDFFDAVLKKEHSLTEEAFNGTIQYVSRLKDGQIKYLNKCFHESEYTLFEQMCLSVIRTALESTTIDITSRDCIIILSTTKGNIGLLNKATDERIALTTSAKLIAAYFKNPNTPIVVSNACISGSLALITGKRLLENNRYKYAIVIGCDCLSDFVVAGFQSFHALASLPCRPFDEERTGLNLGEAAACIILSIENEVRKSAKFNPVLAGGSVSNDANHLSGPSRTGAELAFAISKAIAETQIDTSEIDMISAHGTATEYNDEMEARALTIAGVQHAVLHSLKSYVGHTLGAAGIIESIIAYKSMQMEVLIPTLRFEKSGVSSEINVPKILIQGKTRNILKIASGFGGSNAALVWSKG